MNQNGRLAVTVTLVLIGTFGGQWVLNSVRGEPYDFANALLACACVCVGVLVGERSRRKVQG